RFFLESFRFRRWPQAAKQLQDVVARGGPAAVVGADGLSLDGLLDVGEPCPLGHGFVVLLRIAAASSRRAAPAVKKDNRDSPLFRDCVQSLFAALDFAVASHVAAVFGAVGKA